MNNKFYPLKDYYIIGNLHTCALVSKNASIDWMCLPRFDSPSIFARILDVNAGCFSVVQNNYKINSEYISDTAIVKYHFKEKSNEFILKDFMVPKDENNPDTQILVRKFEGLKGKNQIELLFEPRGNYAKRVPKIIKKGNNLFLNTNSQNIILHLPDNSSYKIEKGSVKIILTLESNDTQYLIMEYFDKNKKESKHKNGNLEKVTTDFWHNWTDSGDYFKYQHETLIRAMITLKLLQYYPNGVLVAAPTLSIPADIGGVRNWDYRYGWIRDITFTLFAFNILDCEDELLKFFDFIKRIVKQKSDKNFEINTVYTIDGEKAPKEKLLKYLSGYKNSKPVRLGNNATTQFQMDTYGDLIDAQYFLLKKNKKVKADKKLILQAAEKICNTWMEKDSGIWEMRGKQRHYTYSKVMCWVGIDRIIRMKKILNLDETQVNKFKKVRKDIKDWVWKNCYNEKKQIIEQYPGAGYQDATNYLFVILQFLDKKDKLTKTIIENTSKELCKNDVFVYRYLADDGFKGQDNAFLICSFWMISAWAILEKAEFAEKLYKKLMKKFAGHILLSEQINKDTGEYTGNFPQAYSHLGIVMTSYYIQKYKDRKKKASEK